MRRRNLYTIFHICWVMFAVLLFTSAAFAQGRGKLQGTVRDAETNEPLPGVNVFLVGTDLGAATDAQGRYFIINVPPGNYSLRASFIGYAQVTKTGVLIEIDRTTDINFDLQTSAITGEEVTVVAERDILHTETSNTQQVIQNQQLIEAPATRSIQDFITKQVGVSGDLGIRGGATNETGTIVNGFTFVNNRVGEPDANIPLSAVEQVSVVTGGFNAEHGNFRSGLVDIVTKSGSREQYSGRIDYSRNIPQMKRFGKSLFDETNYYLRPELDPEVAFVGTETAWADDPYLRGQHASFTGWNTLAEQYNESKPEAEHATPLDLYLWSAWMHQIEPPFEQLEQMGYDVSNDIREKMLDHARKPEGTDTDWNVDFGFGGPVPFVGDFLGNATFYLSNNSNEYFYTQPVTRRSQTEQTTMLTVQSNITSNLKLTLNSIYRDKRGVKAGTRSAGFERINNIIPDGGERWVYAPRFYSTANQYTNMYGLQLQGIVNQNTSWDLRLNTEKRVDRAVPPFVEYGLTLAEYEETGFYEGNPDPRDPNNTAVIEFGPIKLDNMPYEFSSGNEIIDGFQHESYSQPYGSGRHRYTEDLQKTIDSTETLQYRARFDISSQVNFNHLLKAGVQFEYGQIDHLVRSVRYAHLRNNFTLFWDRQPINAGLYVQDQISFEGMVANIGLRADYYNPGGQWPTGNLYSEDAYGTGEQFENKFETWEALGILAPVNTHLVVSPRLGISFPVTERSKFYFNYGHFRSLAPWEEMYIVEQRPRVRLYTLGNPNLAPPRTISYETGVEYNLLNQFLIHVSGYYKDITGQHGDVEYISQSGTVEYDSWENNEYEDVMGLEISVTKNFGRWITGWINYDYRIQKSGLTGREEYYEDPSRQAVFGLYEGQERRPLPRPRLNANVTLHTPVNFGPRMGGIHPLGGWTASFLPTWIAGNYFTWNPLGKLHLQDNLQWPDYYVWDMKVSKNFQISTIGVEAYLNVSNLFNNKIAHFNRGFSSGSDEREYLASLKLPMYNSPEFDDLRNSSSEGYYTAGDDKPGDIRSDDKPYINDPNQKLWLYDNRRDIWFGFVVRF